MGPARPLLIAALWLALASPVAAVDPADNGPADASGTDPLAEPRAHVAAERFAAAIPLLEAAVKAAPDDADAHNLLGYSLRKTGAVALAVWHYERALALDPGHRGALEYLGELRVEQGDMAAARALLARLRAACPAGCEELEDLREAMAGAGN